MTKSERILTRWGIVIANGHGPYLAGLEPSGTTRTSTPLVEYDPVAGTATTASGRLYRMLGDADVASPDVALIKADAAISIATRIHERGLSIEQAAELVGMEADTLRGIVSKGRVDGVSLERLDRIVEALEPSSGRKP